MRYQIVLLSAKPKLQHLAAVAELKNNFQMGDNSIDGLLSF